jgi:MFS family permease
MLFLGMKKSVVKESYNHDHVPQLKEKALKVSIKEGTAANISSGFGDNFVIPFALSIGAKPFHIGILSSFSGFLYQFAQLIGTRMMEKHSRKKIVLWFVFLQALMWLFIALVGIFVWKGIFDGYSVWLLILFYSLLMFFGGISYSPWFSWMGDIVPPEKKGEYFSGRTRVASLAGLATILIAAFFLDFYKTKGLALLAFSILFVLAFTFRFVSYMLFHKQYAPKFRQKKRDYFSLWAFIKKYDNFGKFAVYQGFFNIAVMIASPFFNVYMLKELNFSYTMFTLATVSYIIYYLLFLPLAGKFSDRYGNKNLTVITNVFFVLTPILYCLVKTPLGVILLPQLSAGIASAASVISFSNFIYDAVSPKHRSICVTYTNMLIGTGTLIGAFMGGVIVDYIHPSAIKPYIFVFIVAAALRALVAVIFLPQIKEVRRVKKLPEKYMLMVHPLHFLHTEIIKLAHVPERVVGKFKSLKLLST